MKKYSGFNAIFFGVLTLIFVTGSGMMLCCMQAHAASRYPCIQDAYIDGAYPDDNFGGSDRLLIANSDSPARILVRFAVPAELTAETVASARIVFFSAPWTGGGGGLADFEVYCLSRAWVEGTCMRHNDPVEDDGATWVSSNAVSDNTTARWDKPGGDYYDSVHVSGVFPEGNNWESYSVDVTPLVTSFPEDVRSNGFILKSPLEGAEDVWQNTASREATGYDPPIHPCLEITYSVQPDNALPYEPSNPFPADGAEDVSVTPRLQWNGADPDSEDSLFYDVYFGVAGALDAVSAGQQAHMFSPGTLEVNTAYEWQIVVRDNNDAETPGPVWRFTTVDAHIASVSPDIVSPRYTDNGRYVPVPRLVRVEASGTHFRFPVTSVSCNDAGIKTIATLPLSRTDLIALLVVQETVTPGMHDVTVSTGEETAVCNDCLQIVKYWQGNEVVTVKSSDSAVDVSCTGLQVYPFKGKEALLLAEIVEQSGITSRPDEYYYNLIAHDGYSLERGIVLGGWPTGLPTWSDMEKGYLYRTDSYGLHAGWEDDTTGGRIGQCYNVKYMDGGIIEVRNEDIVK